MMTKTNKIQCGNIYKQNFDFSDSTSEELFPDDYCIILKQHDKIYLEEVTPQSKYLVGFYEK